MSTLNQYSPSGRMVAAVGAVIVALVAGCGSPSNRASSSGQAGGQVQSTTTSEPSTTVATVPCSLPGTPGTANTVPVNEVCSPTGAPRFDTPEAAMIYLADAWDANNIQEIDYVTDPAGRRQMDSMATLMVNLQFKSCTRNPAGDYTCFFSHDITPSSSPTTYPNPAGYPAGEAVFTVAPAAASGWYLTNVLHCG